MSRFRKFLADWAPTYGDVFDLLNIYVFSYGGLKSVAKSPYAHLALLLTAITFPIWTAAGWWDLPLAVLPNLIGFTLSGYAVMMTFGNEKLRKEMSRPIIGKPSAFMAINATFFHFLLLQIIAILLAIVAKSRPFSSLFGSQASTGCAHLIRGTVSLLFWALGYLLFVYALTSALAAAAAIFRVGRWFEWSIAPKHGDDASKLDDTSDKAS